MSHPSPIDYYLHNSYITVPLGIENIDKKKREPPEQGGSLIATSRGTNYENYDAFLVYTSFSYLATSMLEFNNNYHILLPFQLDIQPSFHS